MFSSLISSKFSTFYCRTPYFVAFRFFSKAKQCEVFVEDLTGPHLGVSVLSFNRPQVKNAIGRQFLSEFEESLEKLKLSKQRALIVRSLVPGVFCSGADLKERRTMSEAEVPIFVSRISEAANTLEALPMPTIAAISGAALGGGLELAMACDIRISQPSAKLGLVETKLGIIPGAGGTQRLPRLVGISKAKELMFTARIIDGSQAEKINLVNYTAEDAYSAALELAGEILPQGPLAVRLVKQAIKRGIDVNIKNGLEFEKAYYAQVIKTQDRLEGLKAFQEKRTPVYKGE